MNFSNLSSYLSSATPLHLNIPGCPQCTDQTRRPFASQPIFLTRMISCSMILQQDSPWYHSASCNLRNHKEPHSWHWLRLCPNFDYQSLPEISFAQIGCSEWYQRRGALFHSIHTRFKGQKRSLPNSWSHARTKQFTGLSWSQPSSAEASRISYLSSINTTRKPRLDENSSNIN